MPTNEEGEFELILGNRQLLSVFFIVVILLGIFFTMGYIVGQHSTPLVTADNSSKANPKPIVVESPRETARETVREPEPEPEPVKTAPAPTPAPAPIKTAPQQAAEAPQATEPPKSVKAEKKSPEHKGGEILPTTPSAQPSGPSVGSQPSGTYLQLAATTKREADIMVDVLKQKKFPAVAAEIPEKPGTFRVLVGPMAEAQVNKTKTDLQSAGFPGDKSIKRNF